MNAGLKEHLEAHGCDCPGASECDQDEHFDDGQHRVPEPGLCERAQYLRALADET